MKKLLAIAVVFALFAGVAFAETSVSGAVETRLYLLDLTFDKKENKDKGLTGDPLKDAYRGNNTTSGGIGAAFIQLSGTNDEGTLGGLFRYRNTDTAGGTSWFHRVFVWWKPIPQIRIFLGIDNDGMFDTTGMTGWGFHQGSNDYIFNHHWDFWREVFPGNWDGFGLALSFYPADVFEINLVIPVGGLGWPQATKATVETTRKLHELYPWGLRLQGAVKLDFGKINFVYNLGDKDTGMGDELANKDNHFGRIGVSLDLSAIDNVNLIVGGSVVIPDSDFNGVRLHFGAGFGYSAEKFGIKFRVGYRYQRLQKDAADLADLLDAAKGTGLITANLMPYFNLGPGKLMVDLSLTSDVTKGTLDAWKDSKDLGDKKLIKHFIGWSIIPMYRLPLGGGQFEIGLQLYNRMAMGGNQGKSPAAQDDHVHLRVPMTLSFNF